MMRPIGFFRPTSVGAGWRMGMKPEPTEVHRMIDFWEFENLLPAHGEPVIGGAKAKFLKSVDTIYPR